MKLAWGAKVSQQFRNSVIAIAAAGGFDPSWLMACMYFESGGTFSPSKRNASSGATGLIQFMPSTAIRMGTTVDELAGMTAEDQLGKVGEYLAPYKGQIHSLNDCYMAILWPAAVSAADGAVIFEEGTAAYEGNKALDTNHDGKVTKEEAAAFPAKDLIEGYQDGNVWDDGAQPAAPIEDQSTIYTPQPVQEKQMGAIAIPLLAQLIPQVLSLFSGRAQAQIAKATGASPDVSAQFMQNLISMIGQQVGIPVTNETTATQAVAAVTSMPPAQQATVVQTLEDHSLDYLDKIGPMVDKLAAIDAANNAADLAARNAASQRSQSEKFDMTPWLVGFAGVTSSLLVLALLAAIIWQACTGDKKIDVALIGIAGPLLAISMGVWREIFAYRFDGSSQNTASEFVKGQVAINQSNQGKPITVSP